MIAHAGGTGWDEILVFALPVVILLVLQTIGRQRRRDEAEESDPEDGTAS